MIVSERLTLNGKEFNMKIDRKAVWQKYGGRCAYCGCEITIKEMQVDHVKPKRIGGSNDMDNLNPSCRLCNHYKRAMSLEEFRTWALGGLVSRLRKIYIVRVAEKYGIITINNYDKKFYFEKIKGKNYVTKEDLLELHQRG